MNKSQRTLIAQHLGALQELLAKVEDIGSQLTTIAEEEQEKYDNAPEGLQGGDKYEAIQAAADSLLNAAQACEAGDIGTAISSLEEIE